MAFHPALPHGTCDVVWRDIGRARIHAKLERKGSRYAGQNSGPFIERMQSQPDHILGEPESQSREGTGTGG
jgi:hypothetical protein